MLGVIVRIDGWDPVAGAAVRLRAASHDDPAICHLDGETWWPAIATLPKLRYDLFDGAFTAAITSPSSSMTLGVEPWPLFARYALANARIRISTGEIGTPIGAWTQRFDGRITEQPAIAGGRAEINFAIDDRWLDTSILSTYAGTTGAEGPAALKGQAKPLALGAPRYVAGVLIDSVNSVFQVSAYGPIQAFGAALERLLGYGAPTDDYPSYAALVAAAIPPGRWATAKAVGMARFGAPPTGLISFLVQGDNGTASGWIRKPGQLIRRLALLAGGAGRIDDASLNALDAARPYNLSIYLDQQTSARDLIQRIAASVNAVAGVSWNGQLFVQPFAIGTGALTLAADGSALPPVADVKQVAVPAPYAKLAITAERAWTVHALSDIAFTAELVDLGPYAAGTTYREGNIVQYQGSSWLYRNPTPSAGNAPPTLPVEEDAYWKVLAKAGADGQDGASAFTLVGGTDLTITPTSATKISGGAWSAQSIFHLEEPRTGGCELTFYAGDTSGAYFSFGLVSSPDLYSEDGIHVAFEWHVVPNGNAADIQIFQGTTFIGTYGQVTGQMFAMRYDNADMVWLLDGVEKRRVYVGPGLRFYARGIGGKVGTGPSRIGWASAGARGINAPLVMTQWSIDGATNWHPNFFGADMYYRQSNDGGITYGPAIRGVGEDGTIGADGTSPSNVFRRSAVVPATPATNTGNPPAGWSDGPPAGTDFLFLTKATFKAGVQQTAWSAPVRIDGPAGNGLIASPSAFVIPSFANGTSKPAWTGGSCRIYLNVGGVELAADSYAYNDVQNISSILITGSTITFSDIVGDKGEFTVQATKAGVTYKTRVTVVRAKDGSAAFTSSTTGSLSGGTSTLAANTTVPGGRTTRIVGSANYYAGNGRNGQGNLAFYWRNLTDNGGFNFLGSVAGSYASTYNTSTNPNEPYFETIAGTVGGSFEFTSPSPDKLIEYSIRFSTTAGGLITSADGGVRLEVVS